MATTKIFGWLLLVFGVLIIVFSLFSSWNIFSGKSQPPQIFESGKATSLSPTGQTKAEQMIQEELQKQFQKIIPADSISQLLNLLSWSILAGIFIFGGGQISGIGVRLLKK